VNKPSIIEIIGARVELRKLGREYWGICPFHAEKHPSFSVNEEKGVWHCFGCGEGGNVFQFIMKIESCDAKKASELLGVESFKPNPEQRRRRNSAKRIVWWAQDTSRKLCAALRDIGDEVRVCSMARKELGSEVNQETIAYEASLIRQWAILCDLDDDLNDPNLLLELWERREGIDRLVESLG